MIWQPNYVGGKGPAPARIMFVGEAPGRDEDAWPEGGPFTGYGGRVLDRGLIGAKIRRADAYFTNLSKFRPQPDEDGKDRPPSEEEIAAGLEEFEQELIYVRPDFIVTLGRTATRALLGDVDMDTIHGIPHRIHASAVLASWPDWSTDAWEAVVLPCYHPAAGFHNPDIDAFFHTDIARAGRYVRGELPIRDRVDAFEGRTTYYEGLLDHPNIPTTAPCAVDTEGSLVTRIGWCLTYCTTPGTSAMIRATNRPHLDEFQKFISTRKVYFHNAMFDLEILRSMGIRIEEWQIEDTIVMAYNLKLEPKGLKPLAWRHSAMVMKSYDDLMGPYDKGHAMAYLDSILHTYDNFEDEEGIIKSWGVREEILTHKDGQPVIKKPYDPIRMVKGIIRDVESGKVTKEGPTDPRKRWYNLEDAIRQKVERILGPMPDATFDDVPLQDALDYACRDADATLRLRDPLWDLVLEAGVQDVYQIDIDALPMAERMQSNGMHVLPKHFEILSIAVRKEMDRLAEKIRWYNKDHQYINPNSGDQVAPLLFDHLKLNWRKLTKGRTRPSTNDKVLEAMRHDHPVIPLIIDYRENSIIDSKYCVPLVDKSTPVPNHIYHHVRGNIRDTTVESGRYSMSDPNLMGIPVRTHLGQRVRHGFTAQDGMELGSWDLDQIEMRVMADESGDENLIRIFHTPGGDIHRWTASRMFKMPEADVKPIPHRYAAKRIGFGIITGIQAPGLWDQMELAGIHDFTIADCDAMIKYYLKDIFPAIWDYMMECYAEARRFGHVKSKWGRIRYLSAVHSPKEYLAAEALRQSHSHKISATAQEVEKRGMKRFWDWLRKVAWPQGLKIEPKLQIHDELIIEFEEGLGDLVDSVMIDCLTADSKIFAVPIKAKGTVAKTWGLLEK